MTFSKSRSATRPWDRERSWLRSCRQLADELVEAWHVHGQKGEVLAGEDEIVVARRVVAPALPLWRWTAT